MASKPKKEAHYPGTSGFDELKRDLETKTDWSERSDKREDRIQSVLFWARVTMGLSFHGFIILFFVVGALVLLGVRVEENEFVQEFFKHGFIPVLLMVLVLVSGPLNKIKDIISFFRR